MPDLTVPLAVRSTTHGPDVGGADAHDDSLPAADPAPSRRDTARPPRSPSIPGRVTGVLAVVLVEIILGGLVGAILPQSASGGCADYGASSHWISTNFLAYGDAVTISIAGGYAYAVTGFGFEILDILHDPSNPRLVGEVLASSFGDDGIWQVAVQGRYAYVTGSQCPFMSSTYLTPRRLLN